MIDSANFIVRSSGQKPGYYYIDYLGQYTVADISKKVKIETSIIEGIFTFNGGEYDKNAKVFYFSDIYKVKDALEALKAKIHNTNKGRNFNFSESEIARIRQALINDNSNLHSNSKIKDKILKKLNG